MSDEELEVAMQEIADTASVYGENSARVVGRVKAALRVAKSHDQQIALESSYLAHFSYVDWETGDDDRLRLGDYINCNHQEPVNGYERNFEGQIVAHHVNGVPVVLCDVDLKEPDNSGHYEDLQSLMMNGWEFSRLAILKQAQGKG